MSRQTKGQLNKSLHGGHSYELRGLSPLEVSRDIDVFLLPKETLKTFIFLLYLVRSLSQ